MNKVSFVHAVHTPEIRHVGQENIHLDDPVQMRSCVTKDGGYVGDADLRLFLNVTLDDVSFGVSRHLAGHENLTGRLDGLGLFLKLRPPVIFSEVTIKAMNPGKNFFFKETKKTKTYVWPGSYGENSIRLLYVEQI